MARLRATWNMFATGQELSVTPSLPPRNKFDATFSRRRCWNTHLLCPSASQFGSSGLFAAAVVSEVGAMHKLSMKAHGCSAQRDSIIRPYIGPIPQHMFSQNCGVSGIELTSLWSSSRRRTLGLRLTQYAEITHKSTSTNELPILYLHLLWQLRFVSSVSGMVSLRCHLPQHHGLL